MSRLFTRPRQPRPGHLVLWIYLGALPQGENCRVHVGVALPSVAPLTLCGPRANLFRVGGRAAVCTRSSLCTATRPIPAHAFSPQIRTRLAFSGHFPFVTLAQLHDFAVFNGDCTLHHRACSPVTPFSTTAVGVEIFPPSCVCGHVDRDFFERGLRCTADGVGTIKTLSPAEKQIADSIFMHGNTTAEGVRTALTCVLASAAAAKAPLTQADGQDMYALLSMRAAASTAHQERCAAALSGGLGGLLERIYWVRPHHQHFVICRLSRAPALGKGHLVAMAEDFRFRSEADPVCRGDEGTNDVLAFYDCPDWASDPVVPAHFPKDLAAGPTMVFTCPTCGVVVPRERAVKNRYCRRCARVVRCSRMRGGLRCGHPLAYGFCALCDNEITRDLIRGNDAGSVGPVVPHPVATPPVRSVPVTLVKNISGNADALPKPPKQGRRMQALGKSMIAHTCAISTKLARAPKQNIKKDSFLRGPVGVGPLSPCVPLLSANDADCNTATISGRLAPYMPDPDLNEWDLFERWTFENFPLLFGGRRPFRAPFRMPGFASTQHLGLCRQWAKSFTPVSKAQKKLRGVAALFRQGGTTKADRVLKGAPKRELLQSTSKCLLQPSFMPAVQPGLVSRMTAQSGLACPRMLRYYDSAVVDALFGPDCTIAYKALCNCWSGAHPVRCGGSRRNEDVASFFTVLDRCEAQDALSSDYTLMDNSHGADAHAWFFNVMRRAGFFRTKQHAAFWETIFPQTVKWPKVGTFVLEKGMASGAVWTTLLNTLLNGCQTLYSHHRAWADSHNTSVFALGSSLADFLFATGYRAIHSGDDGVAVGVGLRAGSPRAAAIVKALGYKIKVDFSTTFLGCDPIPCERFCEGQWQRAYCMVPVPHRFLVTLGWALETPPDPKSYVAGVGVGWVPSLSHLPGYGPLLVNMASSNGSLYYAPDRKSVV